MGKQCDWTAESCSGLCRVRLMIFCLGVSEVIELAFPLAWQALMSALHASGHSLIDLGLSLSSVEGSLGCVGEEEL